MNQMNWHPTSIKEMFDLLQWCWCRTIQSIVVFAYNPICMVFMAIIMVPHSFVLASWSRRVIEFCLRCHLFVWTWWRCADAHVINICTSDCMDSIRWYKFNCNIIGHNLYFTNGDGCQRMPIQFDPFNSFRSWFYNLSIRLLWKRNRIYFIKQMYKKIHQEQTKTKTGKNVRTERRANTH